jgi:hypothetical protein
MNINMLITKKDFLSSIGKIKLPNKIAYKMYKLVNKFQEDLNFFQAEYDKLIKLYGAKVDEEDTYTILPENQKKFNDDLTDLLSTKINFDDLKLNMSQEEIENIVKLFDGISIEDINFLEQL